MRNKGRNKTQGNYMGKTKAAADGTVATVIGIKRIESTLIN